MPLKKHLPAFFFFLLLFQGNLSAQNEAFDFRDIIAQTNSADAIWSVSVRDTLGNERISYNSKTLVTPASNLKLLSSAAFLHYLGPDFTYQTKLYGGGKLEGNVWEGDIFIEGKGDPSIDDLFYHGNPFFVFDQWLTQLYDKGITTVDGFIVGNDGYFDQQNYPKGWSWDDLSFYYGVELGALSFNRNTVDLTVKAEGEIGDTPDISWFPFNTDYVTFINEQTITPKGTAYDEYYRRELGTNSIILRSKLPQGYLEEEELSITEPALFTVDTFQKYAIENGFSFGEYGVSVDHSEKNFSAGDFTLLATHTSPPLEMLLHQVNKESDNFYTEMMVKTIAAEELKAVGNTEDGLTLIKNFAAEAGLDTLKINLSDGSGMSASNLITTSNLTQLLTHVYYQDWYEEYLASLAIARVDGTFEYRFRNTPLAGRFMGKSGYISGARTLTGYLITKSGTKVSVSLATNHYIEKTRNIDRAQEAILSWIYRNVK
jgi:D-alanyl-D-alanine carboxypeptidase/D-alanyl-D-alanine-endopeptidase (penicillin-binding protein 4)